MTKRQEAGLRHERDVDFHLRRSLSDEKDVYIFHDVKLEYEGDVAQIDHLVLHKHGFVLIESKSVYGEVSVNANQEWSRSFKDQWYGIPSPVAQAEAQKDILKKVLRANADSLMGKLLGLRKGFGGRKYDILVAISSTAIIHRENMPPEVDRVTFKSEFLASKVKELIAGYRGWSTKKEAWFSDYELTQISQFLEKHQQINTSEPEAVPTTRATRPIQETTLRPPLQKPEISAQDSTWLITCKHCHNREDLVGKYGKWGYYVSCPRCKKNTPMKSNCLQCQGSDTKVQKSKNCYTLNCASCGDVGVFNAPATS